ncbi:MAG: amidohydrolase family protein [Eubacteriales bacterium]|nr:amidohydrolase family protein [Eubacteriales bacterium]
MVIDFHTHAFPDRIYEKTIKILEDNIVNFSGHAFKAVGSGNIDGLKVDMKKNGIDASVVLPIATAPKQTENINNFAALINGKDNIYSFGSLHPENDDIDGILEHIKELGLKGIKLHPEYQSFYIDSKESLKILKKCEDLGLYAVFHTGKDHGCPPPVHCPPKRLRNVLDYVSGKYIIAAHMGGWDMWEDAEKYIIGTPIMIDTCFSFHLLNSEDAKRMIKSHGADKVLFGTDWPWFSPQKTYERLCSLSLGKDETEMIASGNARRILGI